MKEKSKVLEEKLVEELTNDITEYNDIIDILSDKDSIVDVKDVSDDVTKMKIKKSSLIDFRNLVLKTAIDLDGIDNETILTAREKAIFYRLVRIAMWFIRGWKMIKALIKN